MSEQPTRHGYAVNVKDTSPYVEREHLTDEEAQSLFEIHAERFWADAQEIARAYGFQAVYSKGRMDGWAVPSPQPSTDDMWEDEVAEWERTRFRPFEVAILKLKDDAQADFVADMEDAEDRAAREPAEAAHWAARDTITI